MNSRKLKTEMRTSRVDIGAEIRVLPEEVDSSERRDRLIVYCIHQRHERIQVESIQEMPQEMPQEMRAVN